VAAARPDRIRLVELMAALSLATDLGLTRDDARRGVRPAARLGVTPTRTDVRE
jgi:hypothetical protein